MRSILISLAATICLLSSEQVFAQPSPFNDEKEPPAQKAQDIPSAPAVPSAPSAGDVHAAKKAAKHLADEGEKRLQSGDFSAAYDFFRQADQQFPAPTYVIRQARAKAGMGALLDARDLYKRVISYPLGKAEHPLFYEAQEDAQRELEALEKRLPLVTIAIAYAPPGVRVKVDGLDITPEAMAKPIAQDPGLHTVTALVDAGPAVSKQIELKEGQNELVELEFPKPPPPPPPKAVSMPPSSMAPPLLALMPPPVSLPLNPLSNAYNIPAIAAVSAGCAGLTAGIVTISVWGKKNADIRAECNGDVCPIALKPDADATKRMGQAGLISSILGAAGLAGGIALWVIGRPGGGAPTQSLVVRPHPGGVSVTGAF